MKGATACGTIEGGVKVIHKTIQNKSADCYIIQAGSSIYNAFALSKC